MRTTLRLRSLLGLGLLIAITGTAPPTCAPVPANLQLLFPSLEVAQTTSTPWTLAKQGRYDPATVTVSWTITAAPGAPTETLTLSGRVLVGNLGHAPATIGNVVVRLSHWQGVRWEPVAENVADATLGDAATSAYYVAGRRVEQAYESDGSGTLAFARDGQPIALVPKQAVAPGEFAWVEYVATFDNAELRLPAGSPVRADAIVSYGNAGPGPNDERDLDIDGSGALDPDEEWVRSAHQRLGLAHVPAPTDTTPPTLTDTPADLTTTGTVTFSNPVFDLGATSGTVTVTVAGGAEGGTIENCAQLTGAGVDLEACDAQDVPGGGTSRWQDGDVVTYSQQSWGAPTGPASAVLANGRFGAIYSFGLLVGLPGHSARFGSVLSIEDYLPAAGSPSSFDSSYTNPVFTTAGSLGGDLVALRLNVDFGDAGFLASAPVPFGDLTICNLPAYPLLEGQTVRAFLDTLNTAVGDGARPYTFGDLWEVANGLNSAFENGTVSAFAEDHLFVGPCPGPRPWQDGDVVTYSQQSWGGQTGPAPTVLATGFAAIYGPSSGLLVGLPGHSALFGIVLSIDDYLPATGPSSSFDLDYVNPLLTSAGGLGGELVALKLNVDFGDAGLLAGTPVPFGDLTICNLPDYPLLEGQTVREFLTTLNTAVGEGARPYTLGDLAVVAIGLNSAFESGTVSAFAEDHLFVGPCPGP